MLFDTIYFNNSRGFEICSRRSINSERQTTNEDNQTPSNQNLIENDHGNDSYNRLNMIDEAYQVELEVNNDPQFGNRKDIESNITPISMNMKDGSTKIEKYFENFIKTTKNPNAENEEILKGAIAIGDMIQPSQQDQAGSLTQNTNSSIPNHKFVINQMYHNSINPRTMIGAMPPPEIASCFPNRRISNQIINQFVAPNYPYQFQERNLCLKDFITTSSNLLIPKKSRMRNSKEWMIRTKTYKGKTQTSEKKPYPEFVTQYGKKRYIKPQSAKRPNVNMTSLKAYQERLQGNNIKLLTSRNFRNEFEIQNSNPVNNINNNRIMLQQTLKESNSFLVSPINGQPLKERVILIDHGINKRTQSSGTNRAKNQQNHNTINAKKKYETLTSLQGKNKVSAAGNQAETIGRLSNGFKISRKNKLDTKKVYK